MSNASILLPSEPGEITPDWLSAALSTRGEKVEADAVGYTRSMHRWGRRSDGATNLESKSPDIVERQ